MGTSSPETCPCCSASKLHGGMVMGCLMADRYECKCWETPTCERCTKCVRHCLCAARANVIYGERKAQAQAQLPGIQAFEKVPIPKKTQKRGART